MAQGIKHIEDLKPQAMLDFLKTWNNLEQRRKFIVTEKIDGSYLSFGLKEGKFFLRSKNKIFFDIQKIPNIFFMNSFKKYYQSFQKIPLDRIITNLSKKYGLDYSGSIEISGETVPSYDHNIVIYNKAKIGNGIFIIFKILIGDKQNNIQAFWEDLIAEINNNTSIQLYAVPKINLMDFEFNNETLIFLENLLEKYSNFLSKPARKPEDKKLKQKLLVAVKEKGIQAKQQILKKGLVSLFGEECEGYVIQTLTGDLVKIVDKEFFTKRKKQNWYFIDLLQKAQRNFRRSIKEDPKNIHNEIKTWEKELKRIKQDFEQNKNKFISIPKKKQDTENFIKLDFLVLQTMKQMLVSGETSEKVVRIYQQKGIVP